MADGYVSRSFLGRIVLFSLIYTPIEAFLESTITGEISILSAISNFVGGISIALVLGLTFPQLPFKTGTRIGIAWLTLFIIEEFSNTIEAYFFTTYVSTISLFLGAVLVGLLVTFVLAVLVGVLFVPRKVGEYFKDEMKRYFAQRPAYSWLVRIVVASVVYFPIYFAFGGLVAPFVIPYYTDPSLGLVIPSFTVIVPLEFLRGFLYVLALLPIVGVLKVKRRYLWAAIASLLYVPGAFAVFLAPSIMPVQLRIVHGLEILGDSLTYGAVLAYLLGLKRRS